MKSYEAEGQRKSDEARERECDGQNANLARHGSRSMTRDGSLRRAGSKWRGSCDWVLGFGELDAMLRVGMRMRCSVWEREGETISTRRWWSIAGLHFRTIVKDCYFARTRTNVSIGRWEKNTLLGVYSTEAGIENCIAPASTTFTPRSLRMISGIGSRQNARFFDIQLGPYTRDKSLLLPFRDTYDLRARASSETDAVPD